jgi:enamine deaminase RidA (YjgF/YER057c/UK114 family)
MKKTALFGLQTQIKRLLRAKYFAFALLGLKAAGFDMSNIVEGMAYVVDRTKFQEVNAAYRDVFQNEFPARTGVSIGLMGAGAEVEFSFIAVK